MAIATLNRPDAAEVAAIPPSSLGVPKTWADLAQMRSDLSAHFGDVRLQALADRERGGVVGTLDTSIATASWSRRPDQNENEALPADVRSTCEELLTLLGVKAAPTLKERVSANVTVVTQWLRNAAASLHF